MSNLVNKTTSEIAVPDWVNEIESCATGLEEVSKDSLITPRLNIIQTSSEEFKSRLFDAGVFTNSITKESYGNEVELVFLKIKEGAIYLKVGDGLVCRSENGKTSINGDACDQCPYNEYHKKWDKTSQPKCKSTYDAIVVPYKSLLEGKPDMMLLTLKSTSYKLGKEIISRAINLRKPLWAQRCTLSTFSDKNPKGEFYNIKATYPGWIDANVVNTIKELSEYVNSSAFKVKEHEETTVSEIKEEEETI